MVAAGASEQDLLWYSGGGVVRGAGVPGALCMCTLPHHAGFRLHAGRGPTFPCPSKYPLLRPSRLCGSRPFSSPLSALRFLFPRNCSPAVVAINVPCIAFCCHLRRITP